MKKDHWYRLIFEEFLDRTEDGFIVVDKDGVITDINQNYCDFLSRKRAVSYTHLRLFLFLLLVIYHSGTWVRLPLRTL